MENRALAAVMPRLVSSVRQPGDGGRRMASSARRREAPMASDGRSSDAKEWIAAIALRCDRTAFAALFGFYAPRIKGFLVRTGTPPETAEELTQEAMLSVWRKAAQFDASRASVSTWIYTIARNVRMTGSATNGVRARKFFMMCSAVRIRTGPMTCCRARNATTGFGLP